jgi:hypothetical protein
MRITLRLLLLPSVLFIFVLSACGSQQQPTHAQAQAPAPRFSCTSTSVTSFLSHINRQNTAGHNSAQAASTQHMHMGPHMKMTSFQQPTSGDIAYANAIMQIARQCLAKYTDYKLALQDGYRIFEPDVPQDIYHFASLQNFVEAQTKFNPLHPTALLYNKVDNGYQFVGIMFSAPTNYTENQLNERFPLGIAPWHLHVNICLPAGELQHVLFPGNSQFGLTGSITTKAGCTKVGGRFVPSMFGWMVHISPFGLNVNP